MPSHLKRSLPLPILSLYDVCCGRGETQLVHKTPVRILLLRVSFLSGMDTSAGKVFVYFEIVSEFPQYSMEHLC